MQDPITLEALDRDAAIRELGAEAQDVAADERSAFPARAGMLAGGALALGAIPLAFAGAANGLSKSDVKILNYALTLEYLEAAFYAEAVSEGKLSGTPRVRPGRRRPRGHARRRAEEGAGRAAAKTPTFDFKGTTGAQASFLKTAKTLEDTGVAAYQGQAPNIKTRPSSPRRRDPGRRGPARGLGAGHHRRRQDPSRRPPRSASRCRCPQVLSAVKSTGFIQS